MHPILVRIGPVSISSYGVILAVAFLLAVWLAAHATTRSLKDLVPMMETELFDWGCWTMLGGVLGGRALYVLLNWEVYVQHPQEVLALWHGGLVWYGGFVGGLLAHGLFLARHSHSVLRGTDQVIPFVTLGHAVGRIGCFANGCCMGKPTFGWFGVVFPGHDHPLVPVQLIESACLVGLYVLLRALQTPARLQRPGTLFSIYLIGYALIRWTLEYWRADQPLVWNSWTLHQVISVIVALGGLGLLATRWRIPSGKVAK